MLPAKEGSGGADRWAKNSGSAPRVPSVFVVQAKQDVAKAVSDAELLAREPHPDSMRAATRLAVALGRCFSILPVRDPFGPNPRFEWCYWRVLYGAVVSAVVSFNLALIAIQFFRGVELNFSRTASWAMFLLDATTVSYLSFFVAVRWRRLLIAFARLEARMAAAGFGYPARLRARLRLITQGLLWLGLLEHVLMMIGWFPLTLSKKISDYDSIWQAAEDYYENQFNHVSSLIPFNAGLTLLNVIAHSLCTFHWTFNDVFIINMGACIAERLRLLNAKLAVDAPLPQRESYWKEVRGIFSDLATLTRLVDGTLSAGITMSFINNFIFTCIQLLQTLRLHLNSFAHNAYFIVSFGFLVFRTVSVSMVAASINEESRAVKASLFCVPRGSYHAEVRRFLQQVKTDNITLTGCKFFNVSRSFLATILGSIITYEVLLVQLKGTDKQDWKIE